MLTHKGLSVHNVTFLGADTTELHKNWTTLGLRHLSVLDTQLLEPGFVRLIRAEDYAVEAVYHLFGAGAELSRLIDAAAATGARCIYMLTGGRGGLTWEQAAAQVEQGRWTALAAGAPGGRRSVGQSGDP